MRLTACIAAWVLVAAAATAAAAEPSGLILAVDHGAWVGGEPSTVWIDVLNLGDDDQDLLIEVDGAPDGWDVWPWFKQEFVPTSSVVTFVLEVTPPDDGGGGWIDWALYYDDFGPWNTWLDTWSEQVWATPPMADLAVAAVTFDPDPPAVGHEIDIVATLINQGNADVPDFLCLGGNIPVEFWLDGWLVGEEVLSCGLDPWETDDEWITIFGDAAGGYLLEVVIDPYDDVEESNELNNVKTVWLEIAQPALKITPGLPSVAPPGLSGLEVHLDIRNDSAGKIDDVYVALELGGVGGLIDLGWAQGSNLSPGEQVTWKGELPLIEDIAGTAITPGAYTWRYRVLAGALSTAAGGVPLTGWLEVPMQVVPTVEVDEHDVVVPTVDPVVGPMGAVSSLDFYGVVLADGVFDATLYFYPAVDFYGASTGAVLAALDGADVFDAQGEPVCDGDVHARVVEALLLWRDLIGYHPWYVGTFVAVQEGFAWYQDENHLTVLFWLTQPFVLLDHVLGDMMDKGSELWTWVKDQGGFGSQAEAEAGGLAFSVSMVLTKGWTTAKEATWDVAKYSPLLAGEPYVDDRVITEALAAAIEAGGDDLDLAIALVHDAMQAEAPEQFDSVVDLMTPDLFKKAIASTLKGVVGDIVKTGVKKGFQAYFLSELTAQTAAQAALGGGQAALMGTLTAAGAAKAVASFGISLLIHTAVAYLTHVGTYVENVRGPGGLLDVGQTLAQGLTWQHATYDPSGGAGPLDVADMNHTFMTHAVLYELHGFVHGDLAMVKKLAFAKTQSEDFLATAEALFGISKGQRALVGAVEQATEGITSPACMDGDPPPDDTGDDDPPPNDTGDDDPPPDDPGDDDPPPDDPADDTPPPDDPGDDDSPWTKPDEDDPVDDTTDDTGVPADDTADPSDTGAAGDTGDTPGTDSPGETPRDEGRPGDDGRAAGTGGDARIEGGTGDWQIDDEPASVGPGGGCRGGDAPPFAWLLTVALLLVHRRPLRLSPR